MADHHYIAVSKGNIGFEDNQFSYGTSTLPATATVAADIAVLVADGASPTQGHVNTLNTDWGTFLTSQTAFLAALAAGDLVLYLKDSAAMTRNDVYDALIALQGFIQQPSAIAGTQFPVN